MLTPRDKITSSHLPQEFVSEIYGFKDGMENDNPISGKF